VGAPSPAARVGIEKINQMCSQFAPAELAQFRAVKAAFDPRAAQSRQGVPTLHRCAEYGAMRVKAGRCRILKSRF